MFMSCSPASDVLKIILIAETPVDCHFHGGIEGWGSGTSANFDD